MWVFQSCKTIVQLPLTARLEPALNKEFPKRGPPSINFSSFRTRSVQPDMRVFVLAMIYFDFVLRNHRDFKRESKPVVC